MTYIKSLSLYRATKLINKAQENERRENLYKLYVCLVPSMTKNNYISFEKFYDENTAVNFTKDTRSQDEIMEELLKLKFE